MTKKILLKVSGSVAAFKAAALASKLTQAGYEIRVAVSENASRFVGEASFEGLTGNPVLNSVFSPGEAMAHIDWAKWADLTIVYPATANTLTRLASGRADDLIGTLFLAHSFPNPYWVAPAMNPTMFAHPAVDEAIAKLRGWGVDVLDPDAGRMACGDVGIGRLVEPEAMVERIKTFFSGGLAPSVLPTPAVLITAGGTRETIDPVRVLTNLSTGETGVRIANAFAEQGFSAVLALAADSPFLGQVSSRVRTRLFRTSDDLDLVLREELSRSEDGAQIHSLIHAAAVADYRVGAIETLDGEHLSGDTKISGEAELLLRLVPNPKLLGKVRGYANRRLNVISFKLATPSTGGAPDLSGYDSDWIVYNTVADIHRGSDRHAGTIYHRKGGVFVPQAQFRTKDELAASLLSIVVRDWNAGGDLIATEPPNFQSPEGQA